MFARTILASVLTLAAASTVQAADKYNFDGSHSHITFTWNHFGFSNPVARFDRFDGDLLLDTADFSKSSVSVTIPIDSVNSGVAKLDDHFKTPDFFDAAKFPTATFKSTQVSKVGDSGLKVAGDLTLHGVTKPVVLDVTINKIGEHPMAKDPTAGFDATATIKRSDFGMGKYTPGVSDEIRIHITTETHKAK